MRMWPHLANGSACRDGMPEIQPFKAGDMEGRATKRAVWRNRVEEDVNPPTVHKESCRFHAMDPFAEAVPGS